MRHEDTGKLEIRTWEQVREAVSDLKPDLAQVIDKISPSDDHFFVKCSYPFGSEVLKDATLMVPTEHDNTLVPITDAKVSKKVREAINYNLNSNPVSLVLKNSFEIFLPLENNTVPLNGLMLPGTLFGTFRVLHPASSHQPKFLWNMTAGARSIFMLPKITEEKKHNKLKKLFDLKANKPTTLMAHWKVFKELSQHADFPQKWETEILFFSKKWFDHLDDDTWMPFYYALYRSIWGGTEFCRNQPIWNLIFSLILKGYEARPSAYICDTVKYLIHVGIGEQPGFSPAMDNIAAPIRGFQTIYREAYEIRNYPPIIMCPYRFKIEQELPDPVYYSLQFPTAIEFGKSARMRTSLIQDLHDIRALMLRYQDEILSGKHYTQGTPIHDFFHSVEFDYFHNNVDLHFGMKNSQYMSDNDARLLTTIDGKVHENFPDMCPFVKGCIKLSKR